MGNSFVSNSIFPDNLHFIQSKVCVIPKLNCSLCIGAWRMDPAHGRAFLQNNVFPPSGTAI